MGVMFSGFDDGEWWLLVLGCQGELEATRIGQKLAEKCHKIAATTWGNGQLEREGRQKWVCVFAWLD